MKEFANKVTMLICVLSIPSLSSIGQGIWSTQASGTTSNLNCIYFKTALQGWTVGATGTLLTTTDGGTTWNSVSTGTTSTLHGVHFNGTSTGWIVGDNRTIRKTSDAGVNWTTQDWWNVNHTVVNDVVFTSDSTGWAVGNTDSIAFYNDDGTDIWWGDILDIWTIGAGNTINRVHHLDGTYFSLAGDNGVVMNGMYQPFWMQWNSSQIITTENLNDVNFPVAGTGWVVGDNGSIFISTDTGATWTAQISGTTENLNGVYFTDVNNGWAAGDNGTIRYTSNGGTTWVSQNSGVTAHLRNVTFTALNIGWIAGDNGTILHFTFTASAPIANFSKMDNGGGSVAFTDLSSNVPTSWSWDFGDGNSSNTQNPSNIYTVVDSTYYVCLTATNGIGSDTYCDSVYVTDTTTTPGISEEALATAIHIYPNPNSGAFTLEIERSEVDDLSVIVINAMGQEVFSQSVPDFSGTYTKEFDFEGMAKGMYQISITTGKRTVSKQVLVE